MNIDVLLNWAWLAITVSALALLAFFELRARKRGHGRTRRLTSLLLVTVCLFPCVSVSDDLFSLTLLWSWLQKHSGVDAPVPEEPQEGADLHLARLLLTLDHAQVTWLPAVFALFAFVAAVFARNHRICGRTLLCTAGRAPPIL